MQTHFDVAAGQTTDLLLDFDACKSVIKAGNSGNYILKPVVTVVPRVVSGIQGFVTPTLVMGSTTVAAQQNGATVRSTSPDVTGKFSIPFLSTGTYVLVITSDGHATSVITGVPVVTSPTVVNGTATAVTPPVSSMAEVTGTVTVTSSTASATVTAVLTDATARALQALSGGPTIEVGSQAVDGLGGSYRFRLPKAAPVKAAFAVGGPLLFTPDLPVAGKYTIQMQSPGRASQDKPADVAAATGVTVNFDFAGP